MRKNIVKKAAIILLGILICTGFCITAVNGYSNTDRTKIIGFVFAESDSDKQYNKEFDLDSATAVSVVQNTDATSGVQCSILHQPNVWCVQHGAEIEYATYSVGSEIQLTHGEDKDDYEDALRKKKKKG